ncbi:MAG: glycosyltransferase family 9 protein [candidate division Zixibacteria bacterium]|nr:glycosyltransferase family 9 protein [candidate division Zixibacteria bacterium]
MNNILVTRTDRLGDVILSFPVAAALKAHDPGVTATFLVSEYVAPVVRLCPWIDDCIAVPQTGESASLVTTLRERAFDAVLCL